MKPTKKFEVIYDKLKLLNHKAYELMIKFRILHKQIMKWNGKIINILLKML